MRTILIGLLISIVAFIAAYFAANSYPDTADRIIAPICKADEDSWICSERFVDGEGNQFSCRLSGCCSDHGGIQFLNLETEKVICRDETESRNCGCDRITD